MFIALNVLNLFRSVGARYVKQKRVYKWIAPTERKETIMSVSRFFQTTLIT